MLQSAQRPVQAQNNPFAGARLYIDPLSEARRQEELWRTSRPEDAAQLEKIALRPQADWFGDWNQDVEADVKRRVTTINEAAALPLLVAYNIPARHCSGSAEGGAHTAEEYRRWIRAFAAGIGDRPAVIILEPDALAAIDCLPVAEQQTRLDLLRDAVDVLMTLPATSVYIDAGNSAWVPLTTIVARLRAVGMARVTGFALNVANYRFSADEIAYGREISARVGGKHFVIDTSRNGLGPAPGDQQGTPWCNPPGRALGFAPTAITGEEQLDAYLWIKRPGQSDGECNGGPPAGDWWSEYALELARAKDTAASGCQTPLPTPISERPFAMALPRAARAIRCGV